MLHAYPILVLNTGYLIWHSLVDILAVYLVLYLWGGTLLSVTLTWIITMVTPTHNKQKLTTSFHGMARLNRVQFLNTQRPVTVCSHS